MELYKKIIDGEVVIKQRNKIIVIKDEMQYINPQEELLIEEGWERYIPQEPTEEELLDSAKEALKRKIEEYDSSDEVNMFYYQDAPMWLDKSTRAGLLLRFQAEKARDFVTTLLWYNGISYQLNVDVAIQMLYAIELYASACYDNTQKHLSAIVGLKTIEEVESYDYKAGYPEKLRFYDTEA